MTDVLEAIKRAGRALEERPGDPLACARARGALSQAREAWETLDAAQREAVRGPAAELRERVDALDGDPGAGAPPPAPEALLERFGLREFRPGQREAVAAALAGRDTLVVMPTGAGKSLCYQLPALAGRGLVVVVSPLIALMNDQWRRLRETEVRAVMVASGMEEGHNARALLDIESGWAQLVLAAPERFASRPFREAVGTRRVGLFVVDEAHCVAEWGHDFRPDYLRLHGAIAALGRPPVMAATATATPRVAQEIAARLGLREWEAVSSGFDRPNIAWDVVRLEGKGAVARKRAALQHVLSAPDACPAIVYCGTRRDTEEVAETVAAWGIPTVAYHAGLRPEQRHRAQAAFMEGAAEVVVATNAFGMGIDKADVRTVAHWAIPTSLEAYYQEAGRGGRDGRPARAVLLASRMDLGRLIRFNTERDTTVEDVRAYVARLARRATAAPASASPAPAAPPPASAPPALAAPAPASALLPPASAAPAPASASPPGGADRGRTVEVPPGALDDDERMLLSIAERAAAAELEPGARGVLRVRLTGRLDGRAAYQAIKAARDRGWESYRAIERFIANGAECRRRQVLEHFGDSLQGPREGRCCSVCDPDPALERALAARPAPPAPSPTAPRRAAGRPASPAPASSPVEPVDAAQFERLREWRYARAEGKPAYTVAPNTVLEEILRRRPASTAELIEIRGVGPAFCERHGESLLQTLGAL